MRGFDLYNKQGCWTCVVDDVSSEIPPTFPYMSVVLASSLLVGTV